jgi:hypothetical protein
VAILIPSLSRIISNISHYKSIIIMNELGPKLASRYLRDLVEITYVHTSNAINIGELYCSGLVILIVNPSIATSFFNNLVDQGVSSRSRPPDSFIPSTQQQSFLGSACIMHGQLHDLGFCVPPSSMDDTADIDRCVVSSGCHLQAQCRVGCRSSS